MDLNSLMSTIILVAFIVTVVLAVGSYGAYKMREQRRPARSIPGRTGPVFFERFYPQRPRSADEPNGRDVARSPHAATGPAAAHADRPRGEDVPDA